MSITFTEPQMAYLAEEAGKLGISVANLVGRIVDQHRNPPVAIAAAREVYRASDSRRKKAIAEIRQNMDEFGQYVPLYQGEGRRRDLDVYRHKLCQEHPEVIAYSPLPIRLLNGLKNNDIFQFHQLNGYPRSKLRLPNLGKISINILEAYLEFKFPQYKLAD